MKRLFLSTFTAFFLLGPGAAQAYTYSHAESEYSIELPDAPTGQTIWAEDAGSLPYKDHVPKTGAVGEHAVFKREDPETGDLFDVKIMFLKTTRDFLLNLKKEAIQETLEKELSGRNVEDTKFSYSEGTDTLKWGTYSGYSVSRNNDILYHVAHYLAGQNSIMIVRAIYSVQNETYNDYYKAMEIKYIGQ